MSVYLKQWAQNTMYSSEVVKLILQAVTSDNHDFRHVVGKAAMVLESRRKVDREFQNLVKKQINL